MRRRKEGGALLLGSLPLPLGALGRQRLQQPLFPALAPLASPTFPILFLSLSISYPPSLPLLSLCFSPLFSFPFLFSLADPSSLFINLGHPLSSQSISPRVSQAPYPWFPLPHLSFLHQLLIQGSSAQAVTSGGTEGNFFTVFLASSPGVMLATYVSGNVSGEEGEVWSSDKAGCAREFGNSAKDPLVTHRHYLLELDQCPGLRYASGPVQSLLFLYLALPLHINPPLR